MYKPYSSFQLSYAILMFIHYITEFIMGFPQLLSSLPGMFYRPVDLPLSLDEFLPYSLNIKVKFSHHLYGIQNGFAYGQEKPHQSSQSGYKISDECYLINGNPPY